MKKTILLLIITALLSCEKAEVQQVLTHKIIFQDIFYPGQSKVELDSIMGYEIGQTWAAPYNSIGFTKLFIKNETLTAYQQFSKTAPRGDFSNDLYFQLIEDQWLYGDSIGIKWSHMYINDLMEFGGSPEWRREVYCFYHSNNIKYELVGYTWGRCSRAVAIEFTNEGTNIAIDL